MDCSYLACAVEHGVIMETGIPVGTDDCTKRCDILPRDQRTRSTQQRQKADVNKVRSMILKSMTDVNVAAAEEELALTPKTKVSETMSR